MFKTMRNVKTLAYLMAAAMVSTFAMTSCKDEKEPAPGEQGSYSGEEVKTQFSIALPNNPGGPSYMPGASVQKDQLTDFQGMTGITLIPYAKQEAIDPSVDSPLGASITTYNGGTAMTVVKADINRPSSAKVFNDVSIPLTTASFLFYAKSAADNSDAEKKFNHGALIASDLTANPNTFTFSLQQIKADEIFDGTSSGSTLLAYLTSIARASDADPSDPKMWYEYTEAMDAGMYAMFNTFKTMKGLSSFEVARVLTDLYKSLMPITSPIATKVKAAIANATYASVDGSGNVTLVSTLQNFPQEFNIPEGAISIKWDGTSAFIKGDYTGMATPDKYVYPAQLWYYVNSQIKTSNQSRQTMYDNSNSWATILAAHTDGPAVSSRTRAVAIVDSIQYAVARLDVQVRVKDYGTNKLEDNSATAEGARKDVTVNGAGFPISAVLVGGQQQVKYDFTTNGGTEYTIYDKNMASGSMAAVVGTSYSDMNHTLVLENGTSDVMIAVEMTNNTGVDFYGVGDQLIPKNGKFYVVGKLLAASATETSGHVFKQDYTTTAKLTLKDLKTAYNTIPDLRTPQLELGFTVNLSWKAGHTYEINFD